MAFSGWRARHLLLAWVGYWLLLAALVLAQPIIAIRRLTGAPEGTGSFSAGFGDEGLHLTIIERGITVWSGSASIPLLLAALAGPPLLLWLLVVTGRRAPAGGVGTGETPVVQTVVADAPVALPPASDVAAPDGVARERIGERRRD